MFNIDSFYEDPVTTTVALVGSAVEQREQSRAAGRDAERARQTQQKIQDVKSARQRRQAVRNARLQRAELETGAQASGTSTTSSATTGIGNVGTQLASNLSFLDTTSALAEEASIFQGKAAKHGRRGREVNAITSSAIQGASLFKPGG